MHEEVYIVDDRVFLLGLDKLYRDAVKHHESGELLACAQKVADRLQLQPADDPVEGYYANDPRLTEYFRLMRRLQEEPVESAKSVASLKEFGRLTEVTSSPIYGHRGSEQKLLPRSVDALTRALGESAPDWTVDSVTEAAKQAAIAMDDYSLVGLAARIKDAVVLAALRESVVLYALPEALGMPSRPKYAWQVSTDLADAASRFIAEFQRLFEERLPPADEASAEKYWSAADSSEIVGRCVRIGYDPNPEGLGNYHWAIDYEAGGGAVVKEFWSPEIWTTKRYLASSGRDWQLEDM